MGKSESLFEALTKAFQAFSSEEKAAQSKKVNAIFQFDVKSESGDISTWIVDLKGNAEVTKGKTDKKPDVVITVADQDLVDIATGKLSGQKAFTSGKLKVKGNIMTVTKVEGVLKVAVKQAKL